MLIARAARSGETDVVLGLLNDAATWLAARGIDQWTPGQWRAERIAASIERGEVYLASSEGTVVATVAIEWRDELMWPGASDEAGYVHRLAVATAAHGKGIGRDLLRWAELRIGEAQRRFARLDCACDNAALRRYYEDADYGHRGDRRVRGRVGPEFCGSRYEKAIIR